VSKIYIKGSGLGLNVTRKACFSAISYIKGFVKVGRGLFSCDVAGCRGCQLQGAAYLERLA